MAERQVSTGAGVRTVSVVSQAKPDVNAPTLERQAELRAQYRANVEAGRPPYASVRVGSLGELRWILAEHGWTGEFDEFQVKYGELPPGAATGSADLRDIDLAGVNLTVSVGAQAPGFSQGESAALRLVCYTLCARFCNCRLFGHGTPCGRAGQARQAPT